MRGLLVTMRTVGADLAGSFTFTIVFLTTGSARLGAAVGLAIGLSQLVWHLARRRRPPALLVMAVSLTLVLGGLTLFSDDARFLLLKPSIVDTVIATTMLPRGWVVRYVPADLREILPRATLDRVGWGWAALLFATALANLALLALLPPRIAAAVLSVGGLVLKLSLLIAQYTILTRRAHRMVTWQRGPA